MKRLSVVFILLFTFSAFSCTSVNGNQEGDKANITNETKAGNSESSGSQAEPEYLTYDKFLEEVWDFETNPQEWIYKGDVPCVIDFYADWCKPCRMVAPIMDDLAKEYEGKVKIYKVDVDKEKKLASVFQVRSIPAVLFSPKSGRPIMQAGALPKDQYVRIIEENLLKTSANK